MMRLPETFDILNRICGQSNIYFNLRWATSYGFLNSHFSNFKQKAKKIPLIPIADTISLASLSNKLNNKFTWKLPVNDFLQRTCFLKYFLKSSQSLVLSLKQENSTGSNRLVSKPLCNTQNAIVASNDSGIPVSFPLTSLSVKASIGLQSEILYGYKWPFQHMVLEI